MGAIDGVVAGVVDAVVVCWGSERRSGEVRYCREAEFLFGEDAGAGVGAGVGAHGRDLEREGMLRREDGVTL